jgi:Phage portal protein
MMNDLYPMMLCRIKPWPEPVSRSIRLANEKIYEQMQGKSEFLVTGNLKDWERWNRLAEIKVRTLTIGATYDEMDPRDMVRMAALMPNATSHICPKGTLPPGTKMKPEDKVRARGDWETLHSGQNQHRVGILDNGMDVKQLSISNADAEFLASRNFTRQEICGLFGLLPSQIGDTARVAGETFAAQQLTFLTDCLRPWLNKIEQELTRKLLPRSQNPGRKCSIAHDVSDRLKMDTKSQIEAFGTARQWGLMTANESASGTRAESRWC